MPRRIHAKKTNRYSQEFKAKAVQLSQLKGVQVQERAQALDIHPFILAVAYRTIDCMKKSSPE
jgi:transposase